MLERCRHSYAHCTALLYHQSGENSAIYRNLLSLLLPSRSWRPLREDMAGSGKSAKSTFLDLTIAASVSPLLSDFVAAFLYANARLLRLYRHRGYRVALGIEDNRS